ncbi:SphA family protein [Methylomicrobium sp. RS1]|uniref:SphA family protein n=1 Tax=Candidatus Methylomicrobium oryzae TaxID=2802053 RepID=UPI001923214E|nr:transporter [Methylomicrobium sp. RS1]MBL1265227.1 transporter [Methylomicrobium sp. RS1]
MGNLSTDKLKDKNGNPIDKATFHANRNLGPGIPAGVNITADLDASVDMYLIAPTFVWNSGYKIFGADYGAIISLPFANTSVGAALDTLTNINVANRSISLGRSLSVDDSAFDISDIFVEPLWLGWHGKHYDVSAGYGFYAPSGKYHKDDVANTGLGFWSHQLQLAGAYYPFDHKGTALMLAGTYEINHETEGKDFTQGGHFTLNWGLSQFLPITDNMLLEVGPAGYSQWQVQDNHGADQSSFLNSPNQVHAVGGQIGLAFPKANAQFTFHYFTEFAAESRFQGDYAGFTAAVGF